MVFLEQQEARFDGVSASGVARLARRGESIDVRGGNWFVAALGIAIVLFLWHQFGGGGSSGASQEGRRTQQYTSNSNGSSGSWVHQYNMNKVKDDIRDEQFDHCQWSQGCGTLDGAHSGDDDNSITGDDKVDPLDDGSGSGG